LKHPYFKELREQDRIREESQAFMHGLGSAAPTPS